MCPVCDSQYDVIFTFSNVLVKFVDTICILLYTHFPYYMCHCIEYRPNSGVLNLYKHVTQPELDQLHQICSIIITITPPNFSITLQLLCAKNRKLQL